MADKTFLITIGDRTVGGLIARDQMVGPWQVPVADVAVTLLGFDGYARRSHGMGERTPLAVIDAPASGRMAVGEAHHQLARGIGRARRRQAVGQLDGRVRGSRARTRRCSTRCSAVGMELCPALGISIPVGKDSLSMRTRWDEAGRQKQVTAPLSLIVSAFAPCADVRRELTPQLRLDAGATRADPDRSRRAAEPPGRLVAGAGVRPDSATTRPTSTTRQR